VQFRFADGRKNRFWTTISAISRNFMGLKAIDAAKCLPGSRARINASIAGEL